MCRIRNEGRIKVKWQHRRRSSNIEEGAATSEEEWQHRGGPARKGEKIKDFRVWLTHCVVTSWMDLQLKIIHFYRGIAG